MVSPYTRYWEDARLTHFGCTTKPWRKLAKPDLGCGGELRKRWAAYFEAAISQSMERADVVTQDETNALVHRAMSRHT